MRLIAAHAKFVIPAARNAAVYLRLSKPLADNSAFQPAACPHLTRSSAAFKQRFTLFQPFIKGSEEISHSTAYCQNISHRLGRKYCVDLILCKQRRKNTNKGYDLNGKYSKISRSLRVEEIFDTHVCKKVSKKPCFEQSIQANIKNAKPLKPRIIVA